MNRNLRIIFMGTPDFSVPTLSALHTSRHDVLLVVTQPDKPKGRGRTLTPPPVKTAALQLGYDLVQPESIKSEDFLNRIKQIEPDVLIVVAFGHILPESVLTIPTLGAINLHASLLPKYRGSAPIQWAIIRGERETGVTTMFMDKGMDTGHILMAKAIDILADDTSASLRDRLAELGANLLIETLDTFAAGSLHPVPQDHSIATYAPMLKKQDGHIRWDLSAKNIESLIRGVNPWPGAFAFHGKNNRIKVFTANRLSIETNAPPGTVIQAGNGKLIVAAGSDAISLNEVQSASGKRLPVADFLRGYAISAGDALT